MRIAKSRKGAMALAALAILLFHQWIPVLPRSGFFGGIERFIVQTGYWGVDLFFFLSGYALAQQEIPSYRRFVTERAVKILPLFAVAWLCGEFLWFLPSLMVLYVIAPPCLRLCRGKNPHAMLALFLILWALLIAVTEHFAPSAWDLGIFTFRIPVFMLGVYLARYEGRGSERTRLIFGLAALALGTVLLVRFGYLHKLTVPYRDTFYLCALPSAVGVTLVTDVLWAHRASGLLAFLGGITLELYFMQFVLGERLIYFFLSLTRSKLASDLLAAALVTAAAYVLSLVLRPFNHKCRAWLQKL